MGLANVIARMFGRPGASRHEYRPSTMRFMELDAEAIKKKLNLESEGRRGGKREQPAPDNEGFDDVEQNILTIIDAEKKLSHEKLIDHLNTYGDRIRSLGLEGLVAEAGAAADGASADFKARVHDGADVLFQMRRDVVLIEDEIKEFKAAHGLRRIAHYPRSRTLRWGIVFTLLLIESVLNGTFLARGHEFGLTGGVTEALVIALLNIGVGLCVGWKALPNLTHRSVWRKLAGLSLVVLYFGAVVIFNLAVAHYRDALGGDLPEQAATLALESILRDPLGVVSVQSWLLFAMGFGFSLLAAGDGWTMDDPYPGYGRRWRKQVDLIDEYVEQKQELMVELEQIRDIALERLERSGRDIDRRRNELHQIVQSRKNLRDAYGHHLNHLEHCANYLLTSYRRANETARKTKAPAHFGKQWEMNHPQDLGAVEGPDPGGASIDERIGKAMGAFPAQRKRIHADYETAVYEYRKIEQLTPETLRDGAVS